MRATGLEYSVSEKKWSILECSQLFTPHSEASPVKSVIPVSVGAKLIVLSMSREPKTDGTFCTKQKFYEFHNLTKTFACTAVVCDEKMDLPITQWTVLDDRLVTVKASTMMYRHLSRIQYIHEFNSATSAVKTHSVVCAMESGIKVCMSRFNFNLTYVLETA